MHDTLWQNSPGDTGGRLSFSIWRNCEGCQWPGLQGKTGPGLVAIEVRGTAWARQFKLKNSAVGGLETASSTKLDPLLLLIWSYCGQGPKLWPICQGPRLGSYAMGPQTTTRPESRPLHHTLVHLSFLNLPPRDPIWVSSPYQHQGKLGCSQKGHWLLHCRGVHIPHSCVQWSSRYRPHSRRHLLAGSQTQAAETEEAIRSLWPHIPTCYWECSITTRCSCSLATESRGVS